jgi:hypothetical protein
VSNLDTSTLKPGDVVIVEMGIWIIRVLIWLQAVFTGNAKYSQNGHVIVVSHRDSEGRLWGIEGRPGGIGWVEMDKRNGKYGISNSEQPKSDEDRIFVVKLMNELIGHHYDYGAYIEIALQTLGISPLWTDWKNDDVPVHYICSAVADYAYEKRNLPNPDGFDVTRYTTPAQWARFIDEKQWEQSSEKT